MRWHLILIEFLMVPVMHILYKYYNQTIYNLVQNVPTDLIERPAMGGLGCLECPPCRDRKGRCRNVEDTIVKIGGRI